MSSPMSVTNRARDRLDKFKKYNEYRLSAYKNTLNQEQALFIDAIPVLFHINPYFISGCNNPDMPCGIKNLDISDEEVNKSLNCIDKKYAVSEEDKNITCIIEGIYLQECFKNNERLLWIVFDSNLNYDKINLLNRKAIYIENLLKKKRITITLFLTSVDNLDSQFYQYFDRSYHIDKKFLIDEFYAESIIICGKTPDWWLNSDEDTDEKIVNNENYLHIDSGNRLRLRDYYSTVIWHLLGVSKNPISTWLELLLILDQVNRKNEYRTFSYHLRSLVQTGYFESSNSDIRKLYADYIKIIIGSMNIEDRLIINKSFLEMLSSQSKTYNVKTVFDYFSDKPLADKPEEKSKCINIVQYIKFINNIYKLTENLFITIQKVIENKDEYIFKEINELDFISESLLLRLRRSYNNFHIMPEINKALIYQEKVMIKVENAVWHLYSSPDEGSELIKTSKNMIELLSWAYINRIIDTNTRIATNSPTHNATAIDMLNIITFIRDNTKISYFDISDLNAFSSTAHPVKSLIFVNSQADTRNPLICQLNIFNTGEFHVSQYNNYEDFIACVHGWNCSSIDSENVITPDIRVMGVKPGESQKVGTDILDLIKITDKILGKHESLNSRIIFKKDNTYYISHSKNGIVDTHSFNMQTNLLKHLELPLEEFTKTVFIDVFDQSPMLEYLLNKNRDNVIQLFYLIEGKQVKMFVFDEMGSLFTYSQDHFKRQSYINNWMKFITNTLNHLSSQKKVEVNQLLKLDSFNYEHVQLNGNQLPDSETCYSLNLKINKCNDNTEIIFECKNRQFKSTGPGSDIYSDINNFISRSIPSGDDIPVYISDIKIEPPVISDKDDRSLRLFDYLNYKRNVECQLNKNPNSLI
ncbi:MAG: hypothetical protein OQK98_12470 [Gammaproteobacteria bacterium]|nr:hypothetical protein [Gammaproteobacteria bacterium]